MSDELPGVAGYGRQWHMSMSPGAPYDSATPVTATIYQTLADYAKAQDIHPRTVKRWLAASELPGAYQDENDHWKIPADAVRTKADEPANGNVITLAERGGAPGSRREMVRPETTAIPALDSLPSFLTIEQAARLLAPVTEHAIAANKEYYGVVKHGAKGAMLVPLSTVKRIRGV